MTYELKNSRTGEAAEYRTTVDISEKDGMLTFAFTCENSRCYCPYSGYNKLHSCGDAVELLIGSDPERRFYYELELSPNNDLMIGYMEYQGEEDGRPKLGLNFVDDCFITSTAEKTENGYKATFRFPREKILSGDGEVYFNAYRLETDGGEEMNKRLFSLNPVMRTWFHTPDKYVKLGDYVEN